MTENIDTPSKNQHSFLNFFQSIANQLKFESVEEVQILENPNETGWDRIKHVFHAIYNGTDNIESKIITNSFSMGGLCGLVFGAFIQNRQVFESFVQKHNDNIFRGKHEANRLLTDIMFTELFKRSLRHGIRYSLFSGTFVSMLTLCATYRNDIYYRDCALAGSVTGLLWKAHLGPRAILVNITIGSIFGLSFAGIMRLFMKLTRSSIRQMRYSHQYEEDIK